MSKLSPVLSVLKEFHDVSGKKDTVMTTGSLEENPRLGAILCGSLGLDQHMDTTFLVPVVVPNAVCLYRLAPN